MKQVVQIDKQILGRTPCFAGTRVPIRSLFDHLKLGYNIDGFLEEFPTVTREQVDALLEQSSERIEEHPPACGKMKLLLDENLPHRLRQRLPGNSVFTVAFMKWGGIRNGELLAKAAADGFDALLTLDSGFEYEQNLRCCPARCW